MHDMDSTAIRQAGTILESLLLEQCVRPLATDDDPVASYGIESVATLVAQRDSSGFGAVLAAQLTDDHDR